MLLNFYYFMILCTQGPPHPLLHEPIKPFPTSLDWWRVVGSVSLYRVLLIDVVKLLIHQRSSGSLGRGVGGALAK